MSEERTAGTRTVREAVAVFDSVADYEAAVHELLEKGFSKDDIQILAGFATVERKFGHRYRRVEELEDVPEAPRTAFVLLEDLEEREKVLANTLTVLPALIAGGLVVGSGGAILAAIAGAAVAGSLLAAVLGRWMEEKQAKALVEDLEHGGILVWVRVDDPEKERTAVEVLRRRSGRDVHVHEIPLPQEA